MEKKGKRGSNRQNKKKNERRYAGKNKMLHTTECKWERKQYTKSVKVISIKDVIKIRLHMWNTECNYTTCPLCKTEEDTTELIMVDQEGNNTYNLLDENEKNSCNKISKRTGKK